MRRAYTIGAPSTFVNKNGLGRFPEFRDQGVGGSNPLSPTNLLNDLNLILYVASETRGSVGELLSFRDLGAAGAPIAPFRSRFSEARRFQHLRPLLLGCTVFHEHHILKANLSNKRHCVPPVQAKAKTLIGGVETAIVPAAEVVEGGACAGLSLRHADDPSTRRPFKNRCWRPHLPTVPHRSEPVRLLAGLALSSVAISGRIRSPRCSSIVCPCPKGAPR